MKICKVDTCSFPVFGGGYCKNHQYLRTDKKKDLKDLKEPKEKKQLSLPTLLELAQKTFNTYVRLRDQNKGCISCGKGSVDHAGHYFNMGHYTALRFNEANVHGQCVKCNTFEHGNLINYRIGLIKRLGEEKVKWLENHAQLRKVRRYERFELEALITEYRGMIKKLQIKKIA